MLRLGACCGVVALLVVGSAPVHGKTRVRTVRPIDKDGHLKNRYRETSSASGDCTPGSGQALNGYRCFSGSFVHDPCFIEWARGDGSVVCPGTPWSRTVKRLYVGSLPPIDYGADGPPAAPLWGLGLRNGLRCVTSSGAHDMVNGTVVSLTCGNNYGLLGRPDKRHATWRIRVVHYVNGTAHVGRKVRIRTAWYGG